MAKEKISEFYRTDEALHAVYLNAVTPRAIEVNGKVKGAAMFSGLFLIDNESKDHVGLREKLMDVAQRKWPGRDFAKDPIHWPLKAGNVYAKKAIAKGNDASLFTGKLCLSVKTAAEFPPKLVVCDSGKIRTLDTEVLRAQWNNKFYPGGWYAVQVSLVPYDGTDAIQDGVSAYFQMLLFVRDDTRIGGVDAAEVFKDYVGRVTPGVDPTGANVVTLF